MRKSVAISYSGGISYGFLSSYQDRYELVRYNNSRYILDVNNTNLEITDTSVVNANIERTSL